MSKVIRKEIAADLGPDQDKFHQKMCRLAAQYAGMTSPIEPLLDDETPRCNPKCRYANANGACALALTTAWRKSFEDAECFTPPAGRKICVPANNTAIAMIEALEDRI